MDDKEGFVYDVDGPAPLGLDDPEVWGVVHFDPEDEVALLEPEPGVHPETPRRRGKLAPSRRRIASRVPADALVVVFEEPERVGNRTFCLRFVETAQDDPANILSNRVHEFAMRTVALIKRPDGRYEAHIPRDLARQKDIDRPEVQCVN